MLSARHILVSSACLLADCDSARSSAESRMARSRPDRYGRAEKQYTSTRAARGTEAPCPGVDRLGPIFAGDARR